MNKHQVFGHLFLSLCFTGNSFSGISHIFAHLENRGTDCFLLWNIFSNILEGRDFPQRVSILFAAQT